MLSDEIASMCQKLHDTFDDLMEQDIQLFDARRAYLMEYRRVFDGVIDPIEDETMEMNIEICSGPKTLNQSDGTGGGLRAFQPRLFNQKGGNGAGVDLQNRREHLRMGGEQKPQRDRLSASAQSPGPKRSRVR